jgi:hypothetical protein
MGSTRRRALLLAARVLAVSPRRTSPSSGRGRHALTWPGKGATQRQRHTGSWLTCRLDGVLEGGRSCR